MAPLAAKPTTNGTIVRPPRPPAMAYSTATWPADLDAIQFAVMKSATKYTQAAPVSTHASRNNDGCFPSQTCHVPNIHTTPTKISPKFQDRPVCPGQASHTSPPRNKRQNAPLSTTNPARSRYMQPPAGFTFCPQASSADSVDPLSVIGYWPPKLPLIGICQSQYVPKLFPTALAKSPPKREYQCGEFMDVPH